MPRFFINNPVLAWVISIFIVLAGVLSLPQLPISQYPKVAPPQIAIATFYPGASPEDLYQQVTRPIEEELSGIPGMLYFESTSDATGSVSINVTFASGTDTAQAIVDTQNRLRRVEASLPQEVRQQGVLVDEASSSFLMMVALTADESSTLDEVGLGDFASRNVLNELRRVPGVGKAQLFASERAMRIWIDPEKLVGLNMTVTDVTGAISQQNALVAAGSIGAEPNPADQLTQATVIVRGQLRTPEEFSQIVLRANGDGSLVRLSDVARVEIGAETYNFQAYLNGRPTAAIGIQLSPTGNALDTAEGVRTTMEQLKGQFPPGVDFVIPYDTTPFVETSIEKVISTLIEAVALVFVVMFIFLQNFRYTIIPTLVVPIALAGTLAVMLAAGFSINVLTMFAMVLAIGILVDDAIVVVENVERIMREERLSPKDAAIKAMGQISGAIVGITLALCAVFIPLAFFPGSVGIIYKQFSLTMVVSILFSSFLALTLTPALCATLLKPSAGHATRGPFGWFNRNFDRLTHGYTRSVGGLIRRPWRIMAIYLALVVGLGWFYVRIPSAFLPQEDQGFVIADIQGPSGATANRLRAVTAAAEKQVLQIPGVQSMVVVQGFSFSGQGPNSGLSFITLKNWDERKTPDLSANAIAGAITGVLFQFRDAMAFALSPPPIEGLGTSSGFDFRLQDRANMGTAALLAARDQVMAGVAASQVVENVYSAGLPAGPQLQLNIDREKANAFGVTFADINQTLSAAMGSAYVNDFPNAGRMQRVIVQADEAARMTPDDMRQLNVRNAQGGMVPLSAFVDASWTVGSTQLIGYNGYPSVRLSGSAKAGYSSGEAIAEMERLAGELPSGFGFEWTGQSLQEIESGNQAPFLIGLAILFVFLVLAGLYGSWSIPVSVLLVVPLGIIGSVAAVMLRGLSNDVYFTIGIITIVGLSAKNAILIVEVAKDLMAEGESLMEATVHAARTRLRPILMTSLAFTMGVLPMAIATGASSASQNAIGTNVIGGMISATILAIFFVPVFFVVVLRLVRGRKVLEERPQEAPRNRVPVVH